MATMTDTRPVGATYSQQKVNAKIVVVGDSGVGKSSLAHRFSRGAADWSDYHIESTIGVDYVTKEIIIDNYCVNLQIWDTAGQERYHSLVSSYFRNAVGVVAVYDVTNRRTFEHLDYWLKKVNTLNADPVVIIVGNKIDREGRQVTRSEGLEYTKEKGTLFMETSVLIGHGITHIFEKLIRKVLQNESLLLQLSEDIVSFTSNRRVTKMCPCN